jgi:dimethylhistidine N-methyltransferase
MADTSAASFSSTREEILRDVLTGLSKTPRALPGKYLWDETGSDLFDRICRTRDYYLTRREVELIEQAAPEIGAIVGANATLVEYGSGACRKIRTLLDAMTEPARYVAIDISGDFLDASLARLAADYEEVETTAIVADYTAPISLPTHSRSETILGFFPGSTIGNFNADGVVGFLERARATLGGGWFLVGHDTNRDEASLRRAYGDADGLMPALHLNMLAHLNEAIDSDFDITAFRHEITVSPDPARVQAWLVATRAGEYHVADRSFAFAEGDRIHTDTSYKMTRDEFLALAERAGWRSERYWGDGQSPYALHLLRAR